MAWSIWKEVAAVDPRAQSGEEREGKRQGELRDQMCFWRTERGVKTRREGTGGTEGEWQLCMLNQGNHR